LSLRAKLVIFGALISGAPLAIFGPLVVGKVHASAMPTGGAEPQSLIVEAEAATDPRESLSGNFKTTCESTMVSMNVFDAVPSAIVAVLFVLSGWMIITGRHAVIPKSMAGFIAALATAATVFVLIEDLVYSLGLSAKYFLFAVAMSSVVGLPAVLIGGVPIWLLFRRHSVYSVRAFALAGAALALLTYLLLLGLGPLRAYDPPETFWDAIRSPARLGQFLAAAVAGCTGSIVLWLIATKETAETPSRPTVGR
jgi:hypothetical protein